MKPYQHIFFDLDRTLWDFEKNSEATLHEIFEHFKLHQRGIENAGHFIAIYKDINHRMWEEYRKGIIRKDQLRGGRFLETLKHFKAEDKALSEQIGDFYVEESPRKTALFEGTVEVLDYLASKYILHIITNGFEEVQHIKLHHSGLAKYFNVVVTSEQAGCKKPDKEIFDYALKMAGTVSYDALMIGDDLEIDILGARDAGIDQIYFNPSQLPHNYQITAEIQSLGQLLTIL